MGGDPARSLVSLPVGRGCSPGPGHRAASAPLSRRNPPLSTAWSRRIDRECLALEIKQHLFCASSCGDSHGSTRGVDHCELEMARFASFAEIKDSKEGMEDGTEQIARDTAVPNAPGAISELRDRSVLYSDRLTHAGIHNHLWRPAGRRWLWISKASAIEGSGYPARRSEIQRFSWKAKKVWRIVAAPLVQTFAQAVRVKEMARRPPPPPQSPVKRRSDYEDWMEEDDLLDRGFSERDLRHKLQRGGRNQIR